MTVHWFEQLPITLNTFVCYSYLLIEMLCWRCPFILLLKSKDADSAVNCDKELLLSSPHLAYCLSTEGNRRVSEWVSVCVCVCVCVCVWERVCIIPFQFLNQFADFHETCYECYVIHPTCWLYAVSYYRRVNVRTYEAEVTLAPPTSTAGNDGNIYWENWNISEFFFYCSI
jgi:hypothetical protein